MAVRFNPDGTITVGIIHEEESKPVKAETPTVEKPVKAEPKKRTTKKKGN